MEISTARIKELRDKTGAGVMDCRKALLEAEGDIDRACVILKEQAVLTVQKKAQREARQGLIESYIHAAGRIGAMLELNCETDFVARNEEFKELAHNLAMQIAAQDPQFITEEELPENSEYEPEVACLLSQPYIRDPNLKVQDLITEMVAKVGENIRIKRFARFELGY